MADKILIPGPENRVFTTGQVAKICKVTPRQVAKWFDSGRLKGYRIPGSQDRRIPRNYLVDYLEERGERTEEPPEEPTHTFRIEAGKRFGGTVQEIEGTLPIRFISPDGRCMFEVRFADDHAIEVRGVDTYKRGGDGDLMGCMIAVEPSAGNHVVVRSIHFER